MPILGVTGPIEFDGGLIAPFECLTFDWSSQAEKDASLDRLSLKNRSAVVTDPFRFYEALTIPIDDVVAEVDSSPFDVICSFGQPGRLVEIQKRLKTGKRIVAAAELGSDKLTASLSEQVEWLKCAVNLGLDGSYCGMLGVCRGPGIEAYATAQAATGAPLVLLVPDHEVKQSLEVLKAYSASMAKVVFLNARDKSTINALINEGCLVGFTSPSLEARAHASPFRGLSVDELKELLPEVPKDRLLLSPGLCMRHHFTNFGGFGLNRREMTSEGTNAFLTFPWEPPRVEVKVEKQFWTCHICATSGDELVRNYTKMGFTYCSMICLSRHRSAGFK